MRARIFIILCEIEVQLREVLLRDIPIEMINISPKATVPVLLLNDGSVLEESLDIDEAILCMFRDEQIPFYQLKAPSIKEDPFYIAVDDAFQYIQERKRRDEISR